MRLSESSTVLTHLSFQLQSAISTALPTIINHFEGQQFVWIGSAYTLAGVAFLPLSGHFADLFGRRPILLGGLAESYSTPCYCCPVMLRVEIGRAHV